MKTVLSFVAFAIALFTFTFAHPAIAAENTLGAKVFNANCAACHMGGGNVVSATKNLKAEALKQFSMDSADAIIAQVTKGKNAMPAFGGRLTDEQIQSVATYVLDQSTKGWTK